MQTIWSKGAIPPADENLRTLKQVLFPVVDAWLVLGGILGGVHGIPALSDAFPMWVTAVAGFAFAAVALVCLAGASIPKLWLLEIYGKGTLAGMLVGYMIALTSAAIFSRTTAAYVLSLAGVTLTLVLWKLTLLSKEARRRGAKK